MAESNVGNEKDLNSNAGTTTAQEEADGASSEQSRSSSISDSFREYLKLADAEKKMWKNYTESLIKDYYKLKSDVASKKKVSWDIDNFTDYLPDEEKEFLSELQKTREDCSFIRKGLDILNNSIYLMHSELENQANLAVQKLNMKKEEFETSLPFDD